MDDPEWVEDDYDDDYEVNDDVDVEGSQEMNKGYDLGSGEITPEIYKKMDEWNAIMAGIAHTILMRNEDDSLTLHVRSLMPCYGELRKYKETHGDEATQPERRPGDLQFPFPSGVPVAVGVKFDMAHDYKLVKDDIARLIKDDSPWRRGFGSEDDVVQTENGLIFKNTEIDPTVLVHLLKIIQNLPHQSGTDYLWGDMSDLDFFARIFLRSYLSLVTDRRMNKYVNQYMWNIGFDANRYLSGDPHDLTGGTLKDRFDYSRANLQNVFKGDFNFIKALSAYVPDQRSLWVEFPSAKTMQDAIRQVWAECLASSNEQEVKVA